MDNSLQIRRPKEFYSWAVVVFNFVDFALNDYLESKPRDIRLECQVWESNPTSMYLGLDAAFWYGLFSNCELKRGDTLGGILLPPYLFLGISSPEGDYRVDCKPDCYSYPLFDVPAYWVGRVRHFTLERKSVGPTNVNRFSFSAVLD